MRMWRCFNWKQRDADLDAEIEAHLAMASRDGIERGEAPQAAEEAARREFGNTHADRRVDARGVGMDLD